MFKCVTLTIALIFASIAAHADQNFYGSWVNNSSGLQIDILDGFKPDRGPILIIDADGEVSSKAWSIDDGVFKLSIGYETYEASKDPSGSLVLSKSYGDPVILTSSGQSTETFAVSLKDDEDAFISKLQDFVWLTSLEGTTATFKSTFGTDTGVVELVKGKNLDDLWGWSVSSGVIKLGERVVVEARITDKYFVGLDQRDNFVVFKSIGNAAQQTTTDVETQRDNFFNAFLTGEWETTVWGRQYIHKFRPIYGELAGEKLTLLDGRLNEDSKWEYSPSTGALKVGYTEYVGALIVNDTLALIESDGDQTFFNRHKNGNQKRYTLSDVKLVPLSENSLPQVNSALSAQLQRGNFLYSFEFKEDGRTGFTHMWRSSPFNITGETFKTELVGDSEALFLVEDFVIFEDQEVFKMDSSESRLRPKTDNEARSDVAEQEKLQQMAQAKSVKLKIVTISGENVEVNLPVENFAEIATVSIVQD